MSERISIIAAAIKALEVVNPSNFLADGTTPQIKALEEATGFEDITAEERDEALNQVNEPTTSGASSAKNVEGVPTIILIGKTMVRVKEGEEQKAWGSTFTATKVIIDDPETGEDSEVMVLLGEFEKGGHEHLSLMSAKPRRGMIFSGEIV